MGGFALLGAGWMWLLPLAALPVIFHFAYRQRRKKLPMPSLLFFQRLEPRLQSRKRLRDILVLLLRALAILLVLLALARPLWQGLGGGGPAAVVLVVDNSASMRASSRGAVTSATRLATALDAAGALVANLGARDRAGIVLSVPDTWVPALPELTSDRARLRAVLDQVRETDASGEPSAAITRAAALLAADSSSRREIHVFTDLQEHEWGASPAGSLELPPGTVVTVHRILAGEAPVNATLAELRPSDRASLAGRPSQMRATITNPGGKDAAITVSVADDSGHHLAQTSTVPAKGRIDLPVAIPAAAPGMHWARVWIDGDQLAGDNDGYIAFRCAAKRSFALVGVRKDFGTLPLALAPAADGSLSGLAPSYIDVAGMRAALEAKPVLLAIPWDVLPALDPALLESVRAYVDHGGRLLVAPRATANAKGSQQNPQAPPALPSWIGVAGAAPVGNAAGIPLMALDARASLWRDLVGPDGAVRLGRARAFVALPLTFDQGNTGDKGATGALGLEDGRPIIAERTLGAGVIYVSGIAFAPSWSTLPLQPGFLAIAQAMALPPAGSDAGLRLLAGEAPRLPAGTVTGPARARSVAGAAFDWQGASDAPGGLPPFPRAGVYALSIGDQEFVVSVRASPGEGLPGCVAGDTAPALGALRHRVEDFHGGDDMVAAWRRGRTGLEAMPWLLALAFAAVLAEGWLANRSLVRPRAVQSSSVGMPAGAAGGLGGGADGKPGSDKGRAA